MDEAKRELVKNWLIKAKRDLASAKKLTTDPDAYLDTGIYHCQQAGEKAVKAFLVFHERHFDKTHDISLLVKLAIQLQPDFSTMMAPAALLTPYASLYRYPDETIMPSRDEFSEALMAAELLYDYVLSRLPIEVHP